MLDHCVTLPRKSAQAALRVTFVFCRGMKRAFNPLQVGGLSVEDQMGRRHSQTANLAAPTVSAATPVHTVHSMLQQSMSWTLAMLSRGLTR